MKKRNLYPLYAGIRAIFESYSECKLNIGESGIFIDEVDLANVCRVSAKIPVKMFEQTLLTSCYQLNHDPITIGINLSEYSKIISEDLDDDTIFELELIEQLHPRPQLITRINNTVYRHTTIDPTTIKKTIKPFNIEYPIELTVPFEVLKYGVEAVQKYGCHEVEFGVNYAEDPVFFIRSKYIDLDGVSTDIKLSDLMVSKWIGEIEKSSSIQSWYSMDYMSDIIKGISSFKGIFDGNVLIKLKTDYPISISIMNEVTGFELNYTLSPRVCSE